MKKIFTFTILLCLTLLTSQSFARRVYVKQFTDITAWSHITPDAENVLIVLPENSTDFVGNVLPQLLENDEVWVAKGQYTNTGKLTLAFHEDNGWNWGGVTMYGGFEGTETDPAQRVVVDKDGNGLREPWEFQYETNFRGAGNSAETPSSFQLIHLGTNSVLDGVTVSDNYYKNNQASGGIVDKTATLRNCIVRDLTAEGTGTVNGGGLYVTGGGVESCLFESCTATGSNTSFGGALLIYGVIDNSADVPTGYIRNSVLRNCSSSASSTARGGAIFGKGGVTIENCVIYNNFAKSNGGAFYFHNNGDGKKQVNRIIGTTIVNNQSTHPLFPECFFFEIYNTVSWGNARVDGKYTEIIRLKSGNSPSAAYPFMDGFAYHGTVRDYLNKNADYSQILVNGAIGETDSDKDPEFMRATTFQGIATDADKLQEIRKANWTLLENSLLIDAGINAPSNTNEGVNDATLEATFSEKDIHGTLRADKYDIGAYENSYLPVMVNVTGNGNVKGYESGKAIYEPKGKEITYTIVPENGYVIKSVKYNNAEVTEEVQDGIYTAGALTQDAVLDVEFEEGAVFYAVTVNITGNGTVTGFTSGETVQKPENEVISYQLVPAEGSRIKSVKYNNEDVLTELINNTYTASALTGDAVLNVEFELIPLYTVTVNITGNGTVEGFVSGEPVSKPEGSEISYTITPAEGQLIKSVTYNDVDVKEQLEEGAFNAPALTQNSVLNVEFEKETVYYTVTVNIAGNGTVAGYTSGEAVNKPEGEIISYAITPSEGYIIKSVNYNNTDVKSELSDGVYLAPALAANSILDVVFEEEKGNNLDDNQAVTIPVYARNGNIVIENLIENALINVYDIHGALIYFGKATESAVSIPLSGKGLYIVSLEINDKKYNHKIVL